MRVIHSLSVALTAMSVLMIGGCAGSVREQVDQENKEAMKGYNTHNMDLQKESYLNKYKDINEAYIIPMNLTYCGFADERKNGYDESCRNLHYNNILTASDHEKMMPFIKTLRDKCAIECKDKDNYLLIYDGYIGKALFINGHYQEMINYYLSGDHRKIWGKSFVTPNLVEALRITGRNKDAEIYSKVFCVKFHPVADENQPKICKILDDDPKHQAFLEKIANPIKIWKIDNNCDQQKDYYEIDKCLKKQAILYENAIKALPKLGLQEYANYLTMQKEASEKDANSLQQIHQNVQAIERYVEELKIQARGL